MDTRRFPQTILPKFAEMLSAEIGAETLPVVLSKGGIPAEWLTPEYFSESDGAAAADAYARLQSALRAYYGRGARGILLRIGANLWHILLEDAALPLKAKAAIVHALPKSLRRKPALELLGRIIGSQKGDVSLHTLDLDLLLVDRASPAARNQSGNAPICFVTLGMIRECLFWAEGVEYDIEERTCRAMGAPQCEFKISFGG
jgi:predicted hydrocarbon binding protein